MATIRVCCPECGSYELEPPDIRIIVDLASQLHSYQFFCPAEDHPEVDARGAHITRVIDKLAHKNVVNLLIANGCEITMYSSVVDTEVTVEDNYIDMGRASTFGFNLTMYNEIFEPIPTA